MVGKQITHFLRVNHQRRLLQARVIRNLLQEDHLSEDIPDSTVTHPHETTTCVLLLALAVDNNVKMSSVAHSTTKVDNITGMEVQVGLKKTT